MEEYSRKENESDDELIFRICSDKNKIGSWEDVANILNDIMGKNYTESKFRKQFHYKMLNVNNNISEDDNYTKNLQIQKIELQKERQKLSDERTEFNKQIREQARKESFEDMIKRIVCENVEPIEWNGYKVDNEKLSNDMLIPISDIHCGIEIDEFFNVFNKDVLKDRLENYTKEILKIRELHGSENAYIVIGEVVSGIIHNNLRLQNNMDLMQSFQYVMTLISKMLIDLSPYFNMINIYNNLGNHSRISPKKEDSLIGENIDILIPFYLKAKLQNYKNIIVHENLVYKDIAMFTIRNKTIMSAHGQYDDLSKVVQNWTMMFKHTPDIVLLGHRHFNEVTTVYDTKIIQTGSIVGTDPYSISIRKIGKAEQNVAIIDKNGLVCTYDVRLS